MDCTARACIADGEQCQHYYTCDIEPKVATVTVQSKRLSTVEKCKEQHLTWKGVFYCFIPVYIFILGAVIGGNLLEAIRSGRLI